MILKKHFARLYRNAEPGEDGGTTTAAGPAENSGDAIGTGNDARVAMLDRINDVNDSARAEELAEVHDDGTTSEFKVDATTTAELERAQLEANRATKEPRTRKPRNSRHSNP
jgi:hypothetical protein